MINGSQGIIYTKEQDIGSSTENSSTNAWNLNFSNGNLNNWNTKASNQNRVRPVSALITRNYGRD
jgi:hypothetical protein